MQSSVPKNVPSAVPSAVNTVPVLTQPQLGDRNYYQSGGGSWRIPEVPRTQVEGEDQTPGNPRMGHRGTISRQPGSGMAGAPSVDTEGFLWIPGPIDKHYQSEYNPVLPGRSDPYKRVGSPPTRGMFTWVKTFLNHIATGTQDVDNAGWRERHAQQRTSFMRITPPAHGIGYISGEQFTPRQMPQQPNTARTIKATGTQPYGTGVLNTDTLGAGQTAGGIGGARYTPQPGPPVTYSTAGIAYDGMEGMPTWG